MSSSAGKTTRLSILSERVASTAYLWHNYGKSTIGSKDDLEKVPVNRLAEFYKKFYQPDNAVLVITGRLDESKTLQMVADSIGKLPKPARVLDQTYTVEPPQDGERFVALRRVGQGQNVMIAYHAVSAGASRRRGAAGACRSHEWRWRPRRPRRWRRIAGRAARQGARRHEARESASMNFQLQHDPGLVIAVGQPEPGSVARYGPRCDLQGARRCGQESADARGDRSGHQPARTWSREQPVERSGDRDRRAEQLRSRRATGG